MLETKPSLKIVSLPKPQPQGYAIRTGVFLEVGNRRFQTIVGSEDQGREGWLSEVSERALEICPDDGVEYPAISLAEALRDGILDVNDGFVTLGFIQILS